MICFTQIKARPVGPAPNQWLHNMCVCALCAQLCPTLCDPKDCSPPDSSVHRIFQARILEWVAISSSRESSQPELQHVSLASPSLAGGFFTTAHLGNQWLHNAGTKLWSPFFEVGQVCGSIHTLELPWGSREAFDGPRIFPGFFLCPCLLPSVP